MDDFMKEAVGGAKSECKSTNNSFAILFKGVYDPNAKPLTPLKTLANGIANYKTLDLGGYVCSQEIMEKDDRVYIKFTYKGKEYESACDGIVKYINQSKFSLRRSRFMPPANTIL